VRAYVLIAGVAAFRVCFGTFACATVLSRRNQAAFIEKAGSQHSRRIYGCFPFSHMLCGNGKISKKEAAVDFN